MKFPQPSWMGTPLKNSHHPITSTTIIPTVKHHHRRRRRQFQVLRPSFDQRLCGAYLEVTTIITQIPKMQGINGGK